MKSKQWMMIATSFLLFPQLVFASSPQALKALVEEYAFTMTVDWDQRDREFSKNAAIEFELNLRALIEQGLTREHVQAAFGGVNTSALELELMLIDVKDPQALAKFIEKKMSQVKVQGTSWLGEVPPEIWALALLAVVMTVVLITSHNHEEPVATGEGGPICLEYNSECKPFCETRYDFYNNYAEYQVCYDICDNSCKRYQ